MVERVSIKRANTNSGLGTLDNPTIFEVKETRKCIKGIDYEERFTVNQYSLLKNIGEGSFASVKLC
jgi:hypothetical protein